MHQIDIFYESFKETVTNQVRRGAMDKAGLFALPGGTNFQKLSPYLQACALMKFPPKPEVVAPASIEPVNVDDAINRQEFRIKKKLEWRCSNPGCDAGGKNRYSQRVSIFITFTFFKIIH